MTNQQNVDSFVRNLGQKLGVSLSLDDDGRCGVLCKDGLACLIYAPPDGDLLLFEAVVADQVGPGDHLLHRKALEENLTESVGLGAIGYDPSEGALLLRQTFPTDSLEQLAFENLFSAFILKGQALRTDFKAVAQANPADGAGSPVGDPSEFLIHDRFA